MKPPPPTGQETIRTIRQQSDTILMAFSCGKDSIGAWLACRPHFDRIIPYYMYLVPDLEFVEESLAYYERWFGCHIMRIPHPSIYRQLNDLVFQPPEHRAILDRANFGNLSFLDLQDMIRDQEGIPTEAYVASGVRAVDSPYRMIAMKTHGPISRKQRQFFPIWDWNKARLVSELQSAGVKLPVDYQIFGRSFDGIDYRFLAPLKKHFPRDYARILEYFPLADLEIFKHEARSKT